MYRSEDERLMGRYLDELKSCGFICNYIYEPTTFTICDEYKLDIIKDNKPKSLQLSKAVTYTPDFYVKWNHDNLLYGERHTDCVIPIFYANEYGESYIEVKPSFDKFNMTRSVKDKIAFLRATQGIYVQIIYVKDLFVTTFHPKSLGKTRVIKTNLDSFLQRLSHTDNTLAPVSRRKSRRKVIDSNESNS